MELQRNPRPRLRNGLIVDPDDHFLKNMERDPALSARDLDFVSGGKLARSKLLDRSIRYMGIYLSTAAVNPSLIPLIRLAREAHPATPIHVFQEPGQRPSFAPLEYSRLSLQGSIAKSKLTEALLNSPATPDFRNGSNSTVERTSEVTRPSGGSSGEDGRFEPVAIEEFFSGLPNFFDVHVRVLPGKYLKLLNAGEVMDPQRAMEYFRRGVQQFHISRSSRGRCLSYCDHFAFACLSSERCSPEVKLLQLMDNGMRALQGARVNSALDYLEQVYDQIQAPNLDRPAWIRGFLAKVPLLEHSVAVSVAAALLAGPLGITRPEQLMSIGTASLFHDVGLQELPEKLHDEDRSKMTAEDRALFEQHPVRSGDLLRTLDGMTDLAILAVTQHHERRDDSGYPQRLAAGSIHLFSEIIGIADEFIRLVTRKRPENSLSVSSELRLRIFQGFSLPVIEAFEDTFPLG